MVREKISFSFAGRAAVMLLAAVVSSVASNSSGHYAEIAGSHPGDLKAGGSCSAHHIKFIFLFVLKRLFCSNTKVADLSTKTLIRRKKNPSYDFLCGLSAIFWTFTLWHCFYFHPSKSWIFSIRFLPCVQKGRGERWQNLGFIRSLKSVFNSWIAWFDNPNNKGRLI